MHLTGDAGESGAIPSLFLRLSIFPVGWLRRPAPAPCFAIPLAPLGDDVANRWALRLGKKKISKGIMKIINTAILPLFLVAVILTSCNGFASTAAVSPTYVMETAPVITNTAFYTPVPTFITLTPSKSPTIVPPTLEPVPFTSSRIIMTGLSKTGENIYSYPDDPFRLFAVLPSEIELFHFGMQITGSRFTKNELTPTPTAIPTSGWQLLVYRYRSDETYTNQIATKTNLSAVVRSDDDHIDITLLADIMMKDLQTKFGDCTAFTFHVLDEQNKVQQQGYFSINPHHLFFYSGGIKGNFKDGLTIGYQYSSNENEIEFFPQGQFVTIQEPQSGFYRLSYWFDFVHAAGISAVTEQEEVASKLSIRLFPYREDGKYSVADSHPAIGTVHAVVGSFVVDLPIDYMRENANSKFYLKLVDDNGKIIKDEYFVFIPYIP